MDINEMFLNACKNVQKGVIQAFLKKGGIDTETNITGDTPCTKHVIMNKVKL